MKTFQWELSFLLFTLRMLGLFDGIVLRVQDEFDDFVNVLHRNLFCIRCSKNDGKSFFTAPSWVIRLMGGNLLSIIEIEFSSSRRSLIIQLVFYFVIRVSDTLFQQFPWGISTNLVRNKDQDEINFYVLQMNFNWNFLSFKGCVREMLYCEIILRFSCFRFKKKQRNFLFNFPWLGR